MIPCAAEIYDQVQLDRPRGWRRFTIGHAERVRKALQRGSSCGSLVHDSQHTRPTALQPDELRRLADAVRTNNGAVGFGGSLILSWLAWKLVEASVWWAIKWAWRKQWGLDE